MATDALQLRGNGTAEDAVETLIWAALNDVPETVADLAAHWAPMSPEKKQNRVKSVISDIQPLQSILVAHVRATQPDVLRVDMRLQRPDSTVVTRIFTVTKVRELWYPIW